MGYGFFVAPQTAPGADGVNQRIETKRRSLGMGYRLVAGGDERPQGILGRLGPHQYPAQRNSVFDASGGNVQKLEKLCDAVFMHYREGNGAPTIFALANVEDLEAVVRRLSLGNCPEFKYDENTIVLAEFDSGGRCIKSTLIV